MVLTISDFYTPCSHSAIEKNPFFSPNVTAKATLNHPGSLYLVHCRACFTEIFVAKDILPLLSQKLKA